MTIKIKSYELDNGKTRRVAVDSAAPENPATADNDMFRDYPAKSVALWDIRDDEDGVRRVTFLLVRRDLQGQGYLRRLAPHMAKLLGDTPAVGVNVIDPKVETALSAVRDLGGNLTREGF